MISYSHVYFIIDTQERYGKKRKLNSQKVKRSQLDRNKKEANKMSFKDNCLDQLRGSRPTKRKKNEVKSSINIGAMRNHLNKVKSKHNKKGQTNTHLIRHWFIRLCD